MDTIAAIPSTADVATEFGVTLGRSDEFIEAALSVGRCFHDALPIVGRAQELQNLEDFVRKSHSGRVIIISGCAGIGKTSLLVALAESISLRSPDRIVRFALDVATPANSGAFGSSTASYAPNPAPIQGPRLPKGSCVIVIDDAHRKSCTTHLLQAAKDRPEVRFVLTTRPGGLSRIMAQLTPLGLLQGGLHELPALRPLERAESSRAAQSVLEDEFGEYAEALAEVCHGHPQLVAIAGRLLREAALHPVALEQPADFGSRVIARAYETLLIRTSATPDQKLVGGVLAQVTDMLGLVATLAPVRTSDERFLQGAAELLKCRRRDLVAALRALETAGILERSPMGVRVVPMALADHALQRLFTSHLPLPGSMAQRVREIMRHFGVHALIPLFRNAGELDGPSVPAKGASNFVAELFEVCCGELETSSALDRCRLLSALREIAPDQPAAMLGLVKFSMLLPPAEDAEPHSRIFLSETTITNELPRILQRIAMHPAYLPAAIDLLWELGRGDLRLQSSHADHPMRILRDLASKEYVLPIGFHEAVLDAVERWQTEPGAHDHQHSPLDIFETFLADSAMAIEEESLADRQRNLRARALISLENAACSKHRRAALAGIRGLESVLADASTQSTLGFPEAPWRDGERLDVLDGLRDAAKNVTDPVVHFAIADVLRWAAYRTSSDTLRVAAELVLNEVPDSIERRIYEALTPRPPPQRGAGETDLPPSSTLASEPRNGEPRGAEVARAVIDEWMENRVDPGICIQRISEALDVLAVAGKSGSPRVLLQVFSLKKPEVAARACRAIMAVPEGPLGPHVAALLHTLRESAPEQATDLIREIVQGQNAMLCASLAQAFPRWVDRPRPGDQEALRSLLAHRDGFVRRASLGALRTLAKTAPQDAIALALEVDLSEGPEVAETLFGALDAGKLFNGNTISVEDIVVFLSRLTHAPNLEGNSTIRFLHFAAKRLPEETASLLIERLERLAASDAGRRDDFIPLPSEGLSSILARLSESPEWLAILRRIRNLTRVRSTMVRTRAARLFRAASKRYSASSMEVLSEWLLAGRAEEFEGIAVLLEEAPATIFFTHVQLVATLLRNCHALSGELYDSVHHALLPVAMGKSRGPTTGAFLSDAALRTQAREAAAKLAPRSPERRFFETIVKETEALIAEENATDLDDLFDL